MQAIIVILLSCFIAAAARKRGYSGMLWFFVSFLTVPLFAMTGLAALPDKSLMRFRKDEIERLNTLSSGRASVSSRLDNNRTVNNEATIS